MEAAITKGFFKPRRFTQLLFRDFTANYKTTLIAMAAVGGGVLVAAVLTAVSGRITGHWQPGDGSFYFGFFTNILFIGGFIVSSFAFREAHRRGSGIFYMTIPASIFEKLASKLLVTSLGFAAGTLIFVAAVSALSEAVVWLIFGKGLGFFNPVSLAALECVLYYLIFQSVFLLGSLWFKKSAFIKTSLWILLFSCSVIAVLFVLARILIPQAFVGNGMNFGKDAVSGASITLNGQAISQLFAPGTRGYAGCMVFATVGKVLFYGALAPLCWLASYFKLGEIEV